MSDIPEDRRALFEPLAIRQLRLRNRIVMSPMTRNRSPGGIPGPDVARYYARRAEAEVGLIITEGVGIDHTSALGEAEPNEVDLPELSGAASLAGWGRVVEAVHAAGCPIFPQLWHQGILRKSGSGRHPAAPSVSPSGLWGPLGRTTSIDPSMIPAESRLAGPSSEAELDAVAEAYARSAAKAMALGFDGIAIHGAHGYLLDTFLWDETNQRSDPWGGDRRARAAFPAEVVRRIRAAIGRDRPILFRFSQWKQQDFRARLAHSPQELEELLGPLADAGVDVFDASVRYFNRAEFEGSPLNLAGWARKVTGKLSMAVGGIGTGAGYYDKDKPLAATDFLAPLIERFARDEFDLVAVGRALIGDAGWARKLRQGEGARPFDREQLLTLD
jgi:2,4-dienoyl-CoA reductase-like NADH-dependent reductase (Old Yellow Enzyme family)